MSLPKLIYFAARGRAEFIRLILAEAGVAYEDEGFMGPDAFAKLKASGRLPFLAVPVWEEPDGFRLAQSGAIACHIARNHGLHGKTPREQALCDQMLGAFDDCRGEMRKLVTVEESKRAEVRKELTATILPRWFGFFDRMLAANHDGTAFVIGDSVSMADLCLWYIIEVAKDNGFGAAVDAHPGLNAFFKRIGERPRIAAYVASPKRHPLQLFPA